MHLLRIRRRGRCPGYDGGYSIRAMGLPARTRGLRGITNWRICASSVPHHSVRGLCTPPVNAREWRAERLRVTGAKTITAKACRLLRAIMETAVDDEPTSRNPCRIKGAGKERRQNGISHRRPGRRARRSGRDAVAAVGLPRRLRPGASRRAGRPAPPGRRPGQPADQDPPRRTRADERTTRSSSCRIAALAAQASMLCPRMDSPSRFQWKITW